MTCDNETMRLPDKAGVSRLLNLEMSLILSINILKRQKLSTPYLLRFGDIVAHPCGNDKVSTAISAKNNAGRNNVRV